MGLVVTGRIAKFVSATGTVKTGRTTVVGIAVVKAIAADTILLRDGGASGVIKVPAFNADSPIFIPMNITFNTDVHATLGGAGTARYLILCD